MYLFNEKPRRPQRLLWHKLHRHEATTEYIESIPSYNILTMDVIRDLVSTDNIHIIPPSWVRDKNIQSSQKWGTLHIAALLGRIQDIPQDLLSKHELEQPDTYGLTPLHYLVAKGELTQLPIQFQPNKHQITDTWGVVETLLTTALAYRQEGKMPHVDKATVLHHTTKDTLYRLGRYDLLNIDIEHATAETAVSLCRAKAADLHRLPWSSYTKTERAYILIALGDTNDTKLLAIDYPEMGADLLTCEVVGGGAKIVPLIISLLRAHKTFGSLPVEPLVPYYKETLALIETFEDDPKLPTEDRDSWRRELAEAYIQTNKQQRAKAPSTADHGNRIS